MKNPPAGWPRIVPAVFYDDAAAAIDWLARAFGFVVRERVEDDRGRVVHSQLVLTGGVIMVGQAGLSPERAYARSPRAADGANTQGLAVFVDDADAHCERARSAPSSRRSRRLRTTARVTGRIDPTRRRTSRVITGGFHAAPAGVTGRRPPR